MKRHKLVVEKRTVIGKKVYKLRREDILPANIYGRDIKSTAVQIPYKEFEKVYKEAGETGIVDVELDKEVRPSLIKNLQQDYFNHKILHADFFQVNLKEKVTTMVPLVIVGEAKAVTEKIGLLLQPLSEVEVEALPTDLPENIEINVEPLDAIDAQITVKDIKAPQGVTILTDQEQTVVKIGALISKEAEEQAAAEAAAAEAAKAEVTPAEGAAPTAEKTEKTEEAHSAGSGQAKSAPAEGAPKTEAHSAGSGQ